MPLQFTLSYDSTVTNLKKKTSILTSRQWKIKNIIQSGTSSPQWTKCM